MVWRIPIFFVFYLYYKKKRLNDCWISLRKLILFGYWVEIFNFKKCIWRKVLCVWRNGLSYSISVSVEKKEIILVYYFSNAVYFLFNINFKCSVTYTNYSINILQPIDVAYFKSTSEKNPLSPFLLASLVSNPKSASSCPCLHPITLQHTPPPHKSPDLCKSCWSRGEHGVSIPRFVSSWYDCSKRMALFDGIVVDGRWKHLSLLQSLNNTTFAILGTSN